MKTEAYHQIAHIEESHWWFIYRRRLVADILQRTGLFSSVNTGQVLDIGCGTGCNLSFLQKFYSKSVGLELSNEALTIGRNKYKDVNLIKGDANKLSTIFEPESFEMVTLFNVLYHNWVLSDSKMLSDINAVLKPGGFVLLTEPAFSILFRQHDVIDMGKKRYRISEMKSMLKESGFKTVQASYFNSISFFPALLLSMLNRLFPGPPKHVEEDDKISELEMPPDWINKGVLSILDLERLWIRYFGKMPFGVTLILLAQKQR